MSTFRDSVSLLGTRKFGTFWFASLLSSLGTWAQQVAQPWVLLTLGASSFVIGLDAFALNVPGLLLTLIGGALADRADRRQVILGFQTLQMCCPLLIMLLLWKDALQPWHVVGFSAVVGITDALSQPSFKSIVPSIVGRDQLPPALALNSAQFNLSRILGPTAAGVLMSSVGAIACFGLSALSYLPFIGVALWILPKWEPQPVGALGPTRSTLFSGVVSVFRQPDQRFAVLKMFGTSLLATPLITFLPVLVKDVFRGEARQFSMAVASFGVGALLGIGGLLAVPASVDRRKISSVFAVTQGLGVLLCALNPWPWVLPPLLVITGASMSVSNTAANTLLQSQAQPGTLGRSVSVFMLSLRGGISLGVLITGFTVHALGVQHALAVNGALAVLVQLLLMRAWRGSIPAPQLPS